MNTHRGRPDQRSDIRGDALALEVFQKLPQRGPLYVVLDITLTGGHFLFHRVIERAVGHAFAEDFQGHPLSDVGLRIAILDQGVGSPTQHVDEAGGDGEPGCIDHALGLTPPRRPPGSHRHDPVAPDHHIPHIRRRAAAIVDHPAPENDVIGRRGLTTDQGQTSDHRNVMQSSH